ncbi:MAG: PepSY domain-containing protein [Planctomycetota bacterium]|jgi:uncharacterized iron-regulated membrane protein
MTPLPKLARRWHRIGAIAIAAPLLVVILSGILLQLKKELSWVQPPTQTGSTEVPSLEFPRVLEIVRALPEAGIEDWGDVDRIDVRPGKGILKIRCVNGMEVQLDSATGVVLQVARRRSDLIESLHDGSWFHDLAKLWVFLPAGGVMLLLWLSGMYLWWLPRSLRRKKLKARQQTGKK